MDADHPKCGVLIPCLITDYVVPVGTVARNDTRYVLLGTRGGDFAARPITMSVQAFCETVFTLLWSSLSKRRAEEVEGRILERVLEAACHGKSDSQIVTHKYRADGKNLEMDVGIRSSEHVTLIEVKGKSLTAQAQAGPLPLFFRDYAQSFLRMLTQLARHERHVRAGLTPLRDRSDVGELRIERIAVSPVSYGPVGDRLLSVAIHKAFYRVRIDAASDDPAHIASMRTFNKALVEAQAEIEKVAGNDRGEIDLDLFFLFTHWLDLGQIVFALDHAKTVHEALRPIRYVSFQSRDFWTEFAFAARQGT